MYGSLKLIDCHVHIEEFENIDAVLERARSAEVCAIIAVGSSLQSNIRVLETAKRHRNFVFPSLGLHPWEAKEDFKLVIEFIEEKIGSCVALGEVGLDYWINTKRELQQQAFCEVLSLAVKYNKPLIIHSRGAWEDALLYASESKVEKAVFHWYSGPVETLDQIIKKGYFISATPAIEYSKHLQAAIKHVPLERILIETDAPVKYKGFSSEPSDVVKTLRGISKLKGVEESFATKVTTENALKLFDLTPS